MRRAGWTAARPARRVGRLQDRLLLMAGALAEHAVEPQADEQGDQREDDDDGQRFDSDLSKFTLNIVRDSASDSKRPRQHASRHCAPLRRLLVAPRETRAGLARVRNIPNHIKDERRHGRPGSDHARTTAPATPDHWPAGRRSSPNMSRTCRSRTRTRRRSTSGRTSRSSTSSSTSTSTSVADEVHEVVAQDRRLGPFRQRRPFHRRPQLCRPVRPPQLPGGGASARSCSSRRRACSSRSPARSSPRRSQNAGFPPLLLDPIDFGAAYMAQLQAPAAAGAKPSGEPTATDAA